MGKYKVLLISPVLGNLVSFRKEFILKLRELDYDVILACQFEEENPDLKAAGVKMINIPINRRGTNLLEEFKLLCNYIKTISRIKPDVVLTYTSKSSVYGGMACRIKRVPYIINNSGLFDPSRIGKIFGILLNVLHRLGYSKTRCMMYQNKEEMAVMNRILHDTVPYRLLPGSGVNLTKFQPLEYMDSSDVTFLMICRVQKEKGIEEYLYAAEQLTAKYPHAHFEILGGFDEDTYKIRVMELVRKGILSYHEPVKDVIPFLTHASCVVNPSYHEGMSNVLLEAAASARPSITSDCSGCNDIVEDGVNGFLAKVADKESLVMAIERFISLPYEKRAEMGRNGRKIVEGKFDRNIVINAYLEEIEKICNEK